MKCCKNVHSYLIQKGLLSNATKNIMSFYDNDNSSLYSGFDPTAKTLHIGHLMAIASMNAFAAHGYQTIYLVGGATAMLGDPSDKAKTRPLLPPQQIESNSLKITQQIQNINKNISKSEDFKSLLNLTKTNYKEPIYCNNVDFYKNTKILDFYRNIGTNFKSNVMISKDWVKSRLSEEEGITYSEFAYSLFQSHDYLMLHQLYSCSLQIGGSDQWSNICFGIDYVKKILNKEVHGLTVPLLLDSKGKKLSKTEVIK